MKVKEYIKDFKENIEEVYIYQWNSKKEAVDNIPYAPSIEELANKAMYEEKTILYIVLPYGKTFKNDYE